MKCGGFAYILFANGKISLDIVSRETILDRRGDLWAFIGVEFLIFSICYNPRSHVIHQRELPLPLVKFLGLPRGPRSMRRY